MNKLMAKIAGLSMSRIAIFGAIMTVFYFVTMFDSGSAIQTQVDTLKTQIEDENTKKIETQKILQKEEQMRADVAILAKTYEEVKSKIPVDFSEYELRVIIDQYASAHKLETKSSKKADKTPSDIGNSPDSNLVDSIDLSYTFIGTYSGISRFMSDVSSLEKIIKFGNFTISPAEPKAGEVRSSLLNFTTIIRGFKQSALATAGPANKNTKAGTK